MYRMETEPIDEPESQPEESFLKPKVKAKRNLTDEQRLVLAERMRTINDKRIADAMARKSQAPMPVKMEEPPIKLKEPKQTRKVIKVVEVSEDEGNTESESDEEVQYVVVPKKKAPVKKAPVKKAVAKKPKAQPVYESEEEDEEQKTILKPRKKKAQAKAPEPEPPKLLYRFL